MATTTTGRRAWALATRVIAPLCLVLMLVAASVALRADEPAKHFDIKAQPLAEANR